MLDSILNLYKTKKVVFWVLAIVLIPMILILVFKDVALSLLASKANQVKNDADLKDKAFNTALNSLSTKAQVEQQKANDLGKKAQDVEVSTDWNTK